MQRMKKMISVFLGFIMLCGMFHCEITITASAITYNEIIERLQDAKTIYKNGDVWCGTYIANNGSSGPWEWPSSDHTLFFPGHRFL